ncbi:MAG: amino acid ABC transporter permease [Nitriliruptorales bacterium]|nr:amino acid ABC transporter permease [Nitriliruptorales bacterium]
MADTTADRDMAAETAMPGPPDPPERPQVARLTPMEWVRENLFSTWYDTLMTVVFGAGLVFAIYRGLRFLFVTGRWEIIDRNMTNLMVWLWPNRPDLLRPWVALFLMVAAVGLLAGRAVRVAATVAEEAGEPIEELSWRENALRVLGRFWPFVMLLVFIGWYSGSPETWLMELLVVVDLLAFRALALRLPKAVADRTGLIAGLLFLAAFGTLTWFGGHGWDDWGGLMLTIFLAAGGIILSFPLGVGLALGRRSSFPIVRTICVTYIELIRGVPLITLLFMASIMLGFFLPSDFNSPAGVTRALVAIILFTAAYVAEIVRGGLQSVPQGQIEAAQAVGLSPLKQTRLIVLPQALRNVIPALVGQFISLLKDTSLVAIIGQFEILGVARRITNQGDFAGQGLLAETLFFAALVYWVLAYTMSRESQRLEKRLGVGER